VIGVMILSFPISKRLMLVSLRTFPMLRKFLTGCPSSCDVYVALDKVLDKAHNKNYQESYSDDIDDSYEDGSDEWW
jgi:hypothetical protein